MAAGTIALTTNSRSLTGDSTNFIHELQANDFIVVVVGGVTYTLGVSAVQSDTSVTLNAEYNGPTTSGLVWTPIPAQTLVGITAQIAADTARAIRGLNFDKANWQQVFSATGDTITVSLPDGSRFSGPSWGQITTTLNGWTGSLDKINSSLSDITTSINSKAGAGENSDITALKSLKTPLTLEQGGTGAATPVDARQSLELGSAASANITAVPSYNNELIPTLGALGLGSPREIGDFSDISSLGFGRFTGKTVNTPDRLGGVGIQIASDGTPSSSWFVWSNTGAAYVQTAHGQGAPYSWRKVYTEANTTRASDGTIKAASPVVKLFSDGRYETNDESEGCDVTRLDVGQYLIIGCEALNSDAAWGGIDGGFDIPQDRNRQPLLWLDYDVNADGSVLVKTYHRAHRNAPAFAQNNIDAVQDGDPIDIPVDQYVSVRVQMPENSAWNRKQAHKKME